tara:strand:- start:526 stop:1113 length:588 start_codon:yes stop_codon:yes gene_type:complete
MPSKLGFGNSRKKTSGPAKMGSPMHFKNPVKMDHAMKFNAELKKASADGKLSGKFKEAVDAAPTKMYGKAMKHKKDSAGIKHGNAGHLKPADDVSTRGQAATEYYKNNPGAATKKYGKALKHTRTSDGAILGEHTHGGTTTHGKKNPAVKMYSRKKKTKALKHKVEHAGTVSGHSHKGGVGNRPVTKDKFPITTR